jgi:CBS domain-containing protein
MKKTARDFMTPSVITASRGTNGQVLARQLLSGLFSGLPVIEPDGEVVGVVTEFDLLKAFKEGKDLQLIKAEEIMTVPPLCINEDTTLEVTIQTMIEHRVTRLPVVRNRRIVGVVSRANILTQLVDVKDCGCGVTCKHSHPVG